MRYSNSTIRPFGYWIENPDANNGTKGWIINGHYNFVHNPLTTSNSYGTRPDIEISKSRILY